jgi:hypothetical protein
VSRLAALIRSPERVLPFACIAAALILFASELMTTFEFTQPGQEPLCTQDAIDRHAFAPAVLAAFAIGATVLAVAAGSKPAAMGVAICGLVALAIFLLLDLPDASNVGTVGESCGPTAGFVNAEAVPRPGFWLELVGSLALAISGAALASLTPEQLMSLRPGGPGQTGGTGSGTESSRRRDEDGAPGARMIGNETDRARGRPRGRIKG